MFELIKSECFKLTLRKTRSENTTLPFVLTKFTAAVQSKFRKRTEKTPTGIRMSWLVWIQSKSNFPLGDLAGLRQMPTYWTRAEWCQLWAPWNAGNRKIVWIWRFLGKFHRGKWESGIWSSGVTTIVLPDLPPNVCLSAFSWVFLVGRLIQWPFHQASQKGANQMFKPTSFSPYDFPCETVPASLSKSLSHKHDHYGILTTNDLNSFCRRINVFMVFKQFIFVILFSSWKQQSEWDLKGQHHLKEALNRQWWSSLLA